MASIRVLASLRGSARDRNHAGYAPVVSGSKGFGYAAEVGRLSRAKGGYVSKGSSLRCSPHMLEGVFRTFFLGTERNRPMLIAAD